MGTAVSIGPNSQQGCCELHLPPELKKIITFIYTQPPGKSALIPVGTGFITGMPTEQPDQIRLYLVTAKHVLINTSGTLHNPTVYIRLNTTTGTSELANAPLFVSGSEKNVFIHSNDAVDVAVLPIRLPNHGIDFKIFPPSDFATSSSVADLNIREGTEIVFAGLLSQFPGRDKMYPVFRFGRVALIPEEPLELGGTQRDVYLMECTSLPGFSGSPVFFYQGADRGSNKIVIGAPVLKLAGLMTGYINVPQPLMGPGGTTIAAVDTNSNIAVITPAEQILAVLKIAELELNRK